MRHWKIKDYENEMDQGRPMSLATCEAERGDYDRYGGSGLCLRRWKGNLDQSSISDAALCKPEDGVWIDRAGEDAE